MSILGTEAIRAALRDGAIICDPPPARVEGAHIDVTLGAHYYVFGLDEGQRWMGLEHADPAHYFELREGYSFIEIPARGFVLAHTQEFIGTAPDSGLLPMLNTRSTLARWSLSIHEGAGVGDVGFASRWTLEIRNPHDVDVGLPIGARVGCIAFHRVEGAATPYAPGTRYNARPAEWTPAAMLPRKGNW